MYADRAIYTIRHSALLRKDAEIGHGDLTEKTFWSMGSRILTEAAAKGENVAIIFAAAESEGPLLWWATIDDIETDRGDDRPLTRCRYSNLRPVEPPRSLSSLTLLTGKRLSDKFIRPYALVRTPDFVG